MKILKQGTPPPKSWWIGLKLGCDCGAQVELEEGDRVPEYKADGGHRICVQCPACFQNIIYRNPNQDLIPKPYRKFQ